MQKLFGVMAAAGTVLSACGAAHAVCPVCTVAVGAGLEGMRLLGVADVISGIWAGGLTLSIVFWTAGWLKRRGVRGLLRQFVIPFVIMYAMLACIWLLPDMHFGACKMWGMDELLLGIIIGTIVFWAGVLLHVELKARNGGRVYFPFQKVVVPFLCLILATAVFGIILAC